MNGTLSDCVLEKAIAERRRSTRFQLAWPIRIRSLDRAEPGFEECGDLGNLSSGGALVRANCRLEAGSQVDLLIKVPLGGETWMKFVATVTRVEISEDRFGLGLRFATSRPQFISEMNRRIAMK